MWIFYRTISLKFIIRKPHSCETTDNLTKNHTKKLSTNHLRLLLHHYINIPEEYHGQAHANSALLLRQFR